MESLGGILIGTQIVFTIIAGLYFYMSLKNQYSSKNNVIQDSKKEFEKIKKLRNIALTKPLSEKTRPENFQEIIGQEQGIKALRAAICGPNPQHVLIYGPPGIGKTAAARLVLKEAIQNSLSPFNPGAPFIEMDATILQFDERSIADPLIGSIHDPIYQGAGSYGQAGVPKPKPGAVTNAHGGILFIDEIGELHQLQMNKLLKVLEDRKVIFQSSYYSKNDRNIPKHIHDIFDHGLPADFRLIGATTRRPEELPPALRSRCTEIYFNPLKSTQVSAIAANAIKKAGFISEDGASNYIARYSENGRDTVNIVQMAASIATLDNRQNILIKDLEEVIDYGRYTPNYHKKAGEGYRIGVVNGLGVYGYSNGAVMEIEVNTVFKKNGSLRITGIIEEEEINNGSGKMKRKSTARNSIENVLTVLDTFIEESIYSYDIHINFPGGLPIDGPSAGIAIFTALYSAITQIPLFAGIALTGEISIKGKICPVGGVRQKIEAAMESGITRVYIPVDNWQKSFETLGIEIIRLDCIEALLHSIFNVKRKEQEALHFDKGINPSSVLTAKSIQSS